MYYNVIGLESHEAQIAKGMETSNCVTVWASPYAAVFVSFHLKSVSILSLYQCLLLNPDEFVLTETVEEMTAEELFKKYPELRAQATGAGGSGPVTNKVRLQPATGESRVEKGAAKNKKKHRNFFTSSILKLTDWMIWGQTKIMLSVCVFHQYH